MAKTVMGLDIGYGGLKGVVGKADFDVPDLGKGLFMKRSTAAPADKVGKRLSGDDDSYAVVVDGEVFRTCFDPSRVVASARNLAEDFTSTAEYKALFLTALLLSGQTEIDLLVTGLPVTHSKNEVLRQRVESLMTGRHDVGDERFVTVKKVMVIPQPFGGFMQFIHGAQDEIDVEEATVVVVDPGTFSVDWSVFSKMTPLAELNSSSTKASFVLMERVASLIQEEFGVDVQVGDIETRLIAGKQRMLAGGQDVDLMKLVGRAAEEIVPDVLNQITAKVRQMGRTPDRVLLVGGGAIFYKDLVTAAFAKNTVVVPENPVASNAIGFYLYGCTKLVD